MVLKESIDKKKFKSICESGGMKWGLLLLSPPTHIATSSLYLPPPPVPVAPSTLSAIPLPQLLPGRGQVLISRGFQTASLVFSPSRGAKTRPHFKLDPITNIFD